MKKTSLIGLTFGKEGKGKITDYIAKNYDIIARFESSNAFGHCLILDGKECFFEVLPNAAINQNKTFVILDECFIDPKKLVQEIDFLKQNKINFNLKISANAQVVLPHHIIIDKENDTLFKNIGYHNANIDKHNLLGVSFKLFISDEFESHLKNVLEKKNINRKKANVEIFDFKKIFAEYKIYAEILKEYISNTTDFLNENKNRKILFEASNSYLESINSKLYPNCSTSNPSLLNLPNSTKINYSKMVNIGIIKSYMMQVKSGFLPTEIKNENILRQIYNKSSVYDQKANDFYKVGWLDLLLIKDAIKVNNINYLAITALDNLTGIDKIKIAINYNLENQKIENINESIDINANYIPNYIELPGWKQSLKSITKKSNLPKECLIFIKTIEKLTKTKVCLVSVGPSRTQTIAIRKVK